uniref:Uncharacterized protein n=1 Tax=Acrobeloides nanus TaxID=290746 RepID=A0A914ENR1_9BILA
MQRSMRYNDFKLGVVMGIDILIQMIGILLLFIFVNGNLYIPTTFKWPGMRARFVTQLGDLDILLPVLLYVGSSPLRMAFYEIIWSKILPKRTHPIQVQSTINQQGLIRN